MQVSLQRAVPHPGACTKTVDPATQLGTSVVKFGEMLGQHEHDREWCLIEYGDPDPTAFREMVRRGERALALSQAMGGDLYRSRRYAEFLKPYFGWTDELRVLAMADGICWGGLVLLRSSPSSPFTADETEFVASLSADLSHGYRSGILVRHLMSPPTHDDAGPAVVVVDAQSEISHASAGAEERLRLLGSPACSRLPFSVASLVATARRFAGGQPAEPPRARMRTADGRWFVLHALPLHGVRAAAGDVAVIIEEARPPEIVSLVVAAFNLTERERDVTQLVLQGIDTKQIADKLHMSAYTVQDHLKSIFEKAGVHSRRELVARVFFDQYAPRVGTPLSTTGWFHEPPADMSVRDN
jgi:DNA-binding CsgD family transcriptional regulator